MFFKHKIVFSKRTKNKDLFCQKIGLQIKSNLNKYKKAQLLIVIEIVSVSGYDQNADKSSMVSLFFRISKASLSAEYPITFGICLLLYRDHMLNVYAPVS